MTPITYIANNESDTEQLGQALADVLPDSTVISLCGTLGAGKTRLVKAVAQACGIDPQQVSSPTFVLIQEYYGERTIYHMDAYRIKDDDEFLELGPEEYFDSSGLTFVEWADRVSDCLPYEYLKIEIKVTGETEREFEISGHQLAKELMDKLSQRISKAS
ncbi:MAG: tRNA (adenosine(37)-N6)-threonylcarbamoyltransferase complex ATPase subunit type 1 TsaE [Blastopirellula sp.]|nr:MAG: tRNA (adenosine(37)-N6)-threonylcarbamoyltransferase complex ATPase subunit type 1 TsaE [Blastopirellula sp.]